MQNRITSNGLTGALTFEPVDEEVAEALRSGNMVVSGSVVLVKCESETETAWFYRTSGVNPEEVLGALMVQGAAMQRDLVDDYSPDGD